MKKIILVTAALTAISTSAFARPSSLNMTCNQVKALVKKHGAIVLSTGRYTYDRFVCHPGLCDTSTSSPAWVPTKDAKSCFIGYTCTSND